MKKGRIADLLKEEFHYKFPISVLGSVNSIFLLNLMYSHCIPPVLMVES